MNGNGMNRNCRAARRLVTGIGTGILIGLVVVLVHADTVLGQNPRSTAGKKNTAVDVVSLKSGRQLRGMIIQVAGDGRIRMAVEREWMKTAAPDFFEKAAEAEKQETKTAFEQLLVRIDEAAAAAAQDPLFSGYLATQKERISGLLASLGTEQWTPGRFLWVVIPQKDVKSAVRASLHDRRIAGWAWSERLDRVETRSPEDLAGDLKKRNVDSSQPVPDLSVELAAIPETDRQWTARLAMAKSFNTPPLEFQGSGDVFAVVAGAGRPPVDAAALVQQMMGGNMADLIKELTEPSTGGSKRAIPSDAWLKKLIAQAEERDAPSFRVTRLIPDPSATEAAVESLFVVRMPDKSWATVWRTRNVTPANEVKNEAVQRIMEDPQVKSVLSVVQSLGGGAEEDIRKAMRIGAATELSLKKAVGEFSAVVGRYSGALESPPMEFE